MQGLPLNFSTLGISALINILIIVLFCRSLVKTLEYIAPENRNIRPSLVWLLLIPVINYIMNFIVVFSMSNSISNELKSREFEEVKRPAFIPGIISAVLALLPVAVLFTAIPKKYIDIIGILALFQMVFFIQYWMKFNWYRHVLKKDTEENGLDE